MQKNIELEKIIWNNMNEFLRQVIGATSILYGFGHSKFTAKHIGITKTGFILQNHPLNALRALGPTNYLDNSRYAQAIIDSDEPYFWHLAYSELNLTPLQKTQLATNIQNNMNVGLSLSLPFDNGRGFGGVGICCAGMQPETLMELWHKNAKVIEERVKEFDAIMRPLMVANRISLTKREKEVLAYSAGGLTAKEIASHLNIQPKTVYNTLERARRSMKSASTLEAVAKAYVYGLI